LESTKTGRLSPVGSGAGHRKAVDNGPLLVSEATINELADVLAQPKFDRYISLEDRKQFLRLLGRMAVFVPVVYPVQACRDPRDDKFLEVALNGKTDLILSGDADLLAESVQGLRSCRRVTA
jgi:putative PIN family toxin of toxin-antitoxin system